MKSTKMKKLILNKETVAALDEKALSAVHGGGTLDASRCPCQAIYSEYTRDLTYCEPVCHEITRDYPWTIAVTF